MHLSLQRMLTYICFFALPVDDPSMSTDSVLLKQFVFATVLKAAVVN